MFIANNSVKKALAVEKEFVRSTAAELPEKLVIDGKTWTRNSSITTKTQFFPEIRFSFFRSVEVAYYGEWIPENADGSKGHFLFGTQSNYWVKDDVYGTGFQGGYKIWPEYSLYSNTTETIRGKGDGSDFFNQFFSASDSNRLEYTVRTGNSFTTNVEFYAEKETIEAFLRSAIDPNATFNISDYVKTAQLENRIKMPLDPNKPNENLVDAPAGIHNGIYEDILKFRPDIKAKSAAGSTRPSLSDSNWKDGSGKYYRTGRYGDQTFNYVCPSRTENIGYKATYTADGEDGTTIPPSGGGEGTITFIPPSTAWTNIGKPSGFPVQVVVTGQVIPHTWVQSYKLTATTTSWTTDSKGIKTTAPPTKTDNNKDVSYKVTYTMSNITISGGATPTSISNTGGTILVPEGGYRNLSASAAYNITNQETPIPPTVPSTVNTGDSKNGSTTTYSLSVGELKKVDKPQNPTGSAGTYNVDYTNPRLTLGPATNQWSRTILNVPINTYDPPGQYDPSGQSGIQSSSYNVSDTSHYGRSASSSFSGNGTITLNDGIYSIALNNRDVAGNTNAISDRTYYVDTTAPDCDFSVKVNQGINNGTQRVFWGTGVTRSGDKLYGTLSAHDNLSGLTYVGYVWTYGTSDSGTTYTPIYSNSITYYDRDSERPSFNIEKPVGDNMYLHVRMTDSAGNTAYYRYGAYEDPIKVRSFRVSDVRDPAWDLVFWKDKTFKEHTNTFFYVPKLPITDANNTVYRGAHVKKGYAFYFDLTSEYMYRDNDRIEIYPTFSYWDGKTRIDDVDLYYDINNNPFIKVGSPQDTHKFTMKVGNNDVVVGNLSKLTSTKALRVDSGLPFANWKNTVQYTNGKIQWWYGKYYVPATAIFTKKGVSPRPDNLLKKNYIIVNFRIVAYKNGVETNSFVVQNQLHNYNTPNPIFPEITNQWDYEGGSKAPYRNGDVIVYDNYYTVLDDFDTIVTH